MTLTRNYGHVKLAGGSVGFVCHVDKGDGDRGDTNGEDTAILRDPNDACVRALGPREESISDAASTPQRTCSQTNSVFPTIYDIDGIDPL